MPPEATNALLTARLKPVQVGVVNDRAFLVNASLGLYQAAAGSRGIQTSVWPPPLGAHCGQV